MKFLQKLKIKSTFKKIAIISGVLLFCVACGNSSNSDPGYWDETISVKNNVKTYPFNEDEILTVSDSFKHGMGIGEQSVDILYVGFVIPSSLLEYEETTDSGTNASGQLFEKKSTTKFKDVKAIRFDYTYCNKYDWTITGSRYCKERSETQTFGYTIDELGYEFALIDKPDIWGQTGISIKNYSFNNVAPFTNKSNFQKSITSDNNYLTITIDNTTYNSMRTFEYVFRCPTSEINLGRFVNMDCITETEEIVRIWVKQTVWEKEIDSRDGWEKALGDVSNALGSSVGNFANGVLKGVFPSLNIDDRVVGVVVVVIGYFILYSIYKKFTKKPVPVQYIKG